MEETFLLLFKEKTNLGKLSLFRKVYDVFTDLLITTNITSISL